MQYNISPKRWQKNKGILGISERSAGWFSCASASRRWVESCAFERTWRNERTSDAKQVVDIVDMFLVLFLI